MDDVWSVLGDVEGESRKARQALLDYAQMGSGRGLRKLHARYQAEELAPTRRLSSLLAWSSRFDWQARVARFDLAQQEEQQEVWLRRKAEAREQDWTDAARVRGRVMGLLNGGGLDALTLLRVAGALRQASDLMRLAAGDGVEIELGGAALDEYIDRQLARLGYVTKARAGAAFGADADTGG